MKKRNALDMTQGSIVKQLLLFSFPLMLNSILQDCYNMADRMMLGKFLGDNAMAAAGVASAPCSLYFRLFSGFALGVLVCCGNYLGAKDQRKLDSLMHTALVIGFALGVFVTIVGLLLSRPLLQLIGVPQEILGEALVYFRIRFLSTLYSICSAFMVNIMTAFGDTKRTTFFSSIAGLSNVLLNYVFLQLIPLGIAGVAWATFLSGLLNFILRGIVLFSPKEQYQMRFSKLCLEKTHAKQILSIGIPNGLNQSMFSVSNMLLQSAVNSFGALYITANTCADQVAAFASIPIDCLPSACTTAISQCHGAHNWDRMKQIMRKGLLVCEAIVAVSGILTLLLARPLLGLFTDTQAVVDAAIPKVTFYCFGYLIHAVQLLFQAGLKGLKKTGTSFAMNALGVCLPRALWALLVMPVLRDPNVLYAIYPISWAIAAIMMVIAYYRNYNKLRIVDEHAPSPAAN